MSDRDEKRLEEIKQMADEQMDRHAEPPEWEIMSHRERRTCQEMTFIVESWEDGDYRASRARDHQTDDDGRVPAGVTYGTGDSELEAIENLVATLRANQ